MPKTEMPIDLHVRSRAVHRVTSLGEPQPGRPGLYPSLGSEDSHRAIGGLLDLPTYSDGKRELIAVSDVWRLQEGRPHPFVDMVWDESPLTDADAAGSPA